MTATARGPLSGVRMNRSAWNASASSMTSRCSAWVRSSSRRKWRTTSGLLGRQGGAVPREEGGEVARLIIAEDQRWCEADRVGCDGVDDEARVEGGRRERGGDRVRELDRDQQPCAPDVRDERVAGRREVATPPLPEVADVREQPVPLYHADGGERGRGGDGVAAEGRAVLAAPDQGRCLLTEREDRAHREAAAEALGERDDV